MKTKICKGKNSCGLEKPLSEFYKDKYATYGVKSKCKKCVKESKNEIKEIFPEGYKRCIGECKDIKLLSEFPKHRNMKDGRENECKECRKKRNKKWEEENKEERKLYGKQYRENHKKEIKQYYKDHEDELKVYRKIWEEENREKRKQQNKEWYKNNPDKVKKNKKRFQENNPDYDKEYRKNNNEELKQYKKLWDKQNPDYDKIWNEQNPDYKKQWNQNNPDYKRNYEKNRRNNDIGYKILGNLRSRVWYVLKNNIKSARTMKLVGCTIDFLIEYIEKQFSPEMNWDNYGKNKYWEIDHIIPCSSFDLTDPEQQRKCFHYTNLQPLTIKDNREKSNKLNWIKQ